MGRKTGTPWPYPEAPIPIRSFTDPGGTAFQTMMVPNGPEEAGAGTLSCATTYLGKIYTPPLYDRLEQNISARPQKNLRAEYEHPRQSQPTLRVRPLGVATRRRRNSQVDIPNSVNYGFMDAGTSPRFIPSRVK